MDKFKVGDRVKCVDGWHMADPRIGATYIIKGIRGPFLDFEFGTGWLDSRFELSRPLFKGNSK